MCTLSKVSKLSRATTRTQQHVPLSCSTPYFRHGIEVPHTAFTSFICACYITGRVWAQVWTSSTETQDVDWVHLVMRQFHKANQVLNTHFGTGLCMYHYSLIDIKPDDINEKDPPLIFPSFRAYGTVTPTPVSP